MDLDHLREFLALVETGSFARASERLSISQPAISKHIQALETELGARLLNRGQKAVTLSEFGAVLFPYAKRILSEQEQYFEMAHKLERPQRNALHIGTIGVLHLYGLMEPINRFAMEHPDVEIHIQRSDMDMKEPLLDGHIDLAFVREPVKLFLEDDRFAALECVADSVVAVLPAGHPLAERRMVDLIELKDEAFYFLDRQLPLIKLCVNTCRSAGFSPMVAGSGFSGQDIIGHVSQGNGVTLLGKIPFTRHFGGNKAVVAVDIRQYMRTYITLLYRRDVDHPIVNGMFLPFFRDQLARIQRSAQYG